MKAIEAIRNLRDLVGDLGLDDDEVIGWFGVLYQAIEQRASLLVALTAIVEAVNDEWEGPPFSEPLLTDRDHRLLGQAEAAIAKAKGAETNE